jgi:hypothetical protein
VGLVTFASVKASPGVTTTAALVAARWPDLRLLVEADESGGVLAADLDLGETPGVLELAGVARAVDDDAIGRHSQVAFGDTPVLVGPGEPHRVAASWRELGQPLATHLVRSEVTGIVDAGRLTPGSPAWPLAAASGLVVLVARCRLAEFLPLSGRCAELRAAGARVALVVIADGPYLPAEFAGEAGVELLAALPHDPAAAGLARGRTLSARALGRSPLWTAAGALAEQLHSRLNTLTRNGVHERAAG